MTQAARAEAMIETLTRLVRARRKQHDDEQHPDDGLASLVTALREIIDGSLLPANDVVVMGREDEARLQSVDLSRTGGSKYTPSSTPHYLESYYEDESLRPSTVGLHERPCAAVSADGTPHSLSEEERILLGVGPKAKAEAKAEVNAEAKAEVNAEAKAEVNAEAKAEVHAEAKAEVRAEVRAETERTPVMIHMLEGPPKRGEVAQFAPASGTVELWPDAPSDSGPERVPIRQVLAVFLGRPRSAPSHGRAEAPPQGQVIVARLVNGRAIRGITSDYRPGATAMTVVPQPSRPGIVLIWVPAWSVRAIEIEG
ncbi:MAG: hypothetical protein IPK13_04460 [Deltaproteobacteria bacterium]|nr:hypothetical protein [Deltaproteobacteria bacterium]